MVVVDPEGVAVSEVERKEGELEGDFLVRDDVFLVSEVRDGDLVGVAGGRVAALFVGLFAPLVVFFMVFFI